MNLTLSTEQSQLKDNAARFVARHGVRGELAGALAHSGGSRRDIWNGAAELGWLGAGLSEDEGGFGGGPVETMVIMEEAGRGLMPEPFLTAAIAARLLAETRPGSDLVAALVSGEEVIVPALDDGRTPGAGTTLSGEAGARTLSGVKELVAAAEHADRLIVSCSTPEGVAALAAIPANVAGVNMDGYRTMDGRRAATISFQAVAVPEDAILALGDKAGAALAAAKDAALAALSAEAVGIAYFLIDQTLDYLKTRHQFGQPIGRFQALQHRMADLFVALEEARSLTVMATVSLGGEDTAARARTVSAARIGTISRTLHVAREAIQLHGGVGMTAEYAVGHYFKRVTMIDATFGDADHHLRALAARGGLFQAA